MNFEEKLIYFYVHDRLKFFEEIKNNANESKSEVCSCILLMKTHLYDSQKFDEVHEKLNVVSVESVGPILSFFFYYFWFIFNVQNFREKEAPIILGKMERIINKDTSDFLKAEFLMCKAQIVGSDNAIRIFKEGLSLLPVQSERYKNAIKTLFDHYSQNGLLNEVEPKYFESLTKQFFYMFSFLNAVENGQTSLALKYKEDFLASPISLPRPAEIRLENSINLLKMYLGEKESVQLNVWVMPIKALLDKDLTLALKSAKVFYDKYHKEVNIATNFSSFTLLRAQLSNKNLDAAKMIVESWTKTLESYLFADFFMARLELLNNNIEKAVRHFAKVLAYCRKNDAMGRLDFELELALELQPKQIRFLMENANAVLSSTINLKDVVSINEKSIKDVGIDRIKGASVTIKTIKEDILKFANLDIPVLILGETGVGKDLIAKAIHEESNRKSKPFIAINCSAIAETLLLSELFGHESGAYTGANKAHKGIFQEADDGTVFLDEIGDISSGLQTALLRVLDSGEYRPVGSAKSKIAKCRIIAATNALLESRVDAGAFRLDLLYRLKRLVIQVPPLRERPIDISFLSRHYLGLTSSSVSSLQLSRELEDAFLAYSWPGNVRELKNEMEKIRLLHSGKSPYSLEDANFLNTKSGNNAKKEMEENLVDESAATNLKSKNKTTTKDNKVMHADVFQKSGSYFRRMDEIKALFIEHKKLSRKEICQITGVANLTIGRDLKSLRAENFIRKVEPTPAPRTHYFVIIEN